MRLRKMPSPYTSIANDVLRDQTLSLRAKGLLALLLSLPDNWRFNLTWIVEQSREGRDATRAALAELRERRYVVTVPARSEDGRRLAGYDWYISDAPIEDVPGGPGGGGVTDLGPDMDMAEADDVADPDPAPEPSGVRETRTTDFQASWKSATTNKEVTNKEPTKPTTTYSPLSTQAGRRVSQKEMWVKTKKREQEVLGALRAHDPGLVPRLTGLHVRLNRRDSREAMMRWVAHQLHPRLQELGSGPFVTTLEQALNKIEANPMINNPFAYIAKQLERARVEQRARVAHGQPAIPPEQFLAMLMEV